jgi:hypothetical protein
MLLVICIDVGGRQLIDSIAANIDQDSVGVIQNRRPELIEGTLFGVCKVVLDYQSQDHQ